MPPPPISFIGMYLSSRQVFGQTMEPEFLRDRIRSYGWKPSIARLAQLASYVQAPGRSDEEIRQRTVDPILSITGDRRAAPLIEHAQRFVRGNRDRMQVVHEEVISYLQHLVLVEGGDSEDVPTDAELSFWMLGANCYLEEWAEADSRELSRVEELIAIQTRGHCFNQSHHWAALAVRSYELFRQCPEDESLGGHSAWQQMQLETFGALFPRYYAVILAPLLGISWRLDDRASGVPAVGIEYWRTIEADLDWVRARLNALALSRNQARDQILAAENARSEHGLLHAPSLLRRKPLLVEDEGWLITSPANIATQLRAGPWGAYLERSKAAHGDAVGFLRWSSAFGVAFERYCASLADAARASRRFRRGWTMILPIESGTEEEIEDVILIEDDHAVVFSVKASLLPEGSVLRAKSRSAVIDWLDRFLFSENRNFKGAVRKLSANLDEIRRGDFEDRGIRRDLRILPVLVTYDEIGEDVFLYQRIREKSRAAGLLAQSNVAPLTIASIDSFEWMMEYVREGRSLVGLLRKRKPGRPWFDRRIDQQLGQVSPPVQFATIQERFDAIFGDVLQTLRSARAELGDGDGVASDDDADE